MIAALSLLCVLPFIHVLAVSLSENAAVMGGMVILWPVRFTLENYVYVLERSAFWRAFAVTIERVAIGLPLGLFLCITAAYPLSKPGHKLKFRTGYVWFFFFTMLFSGGLIPSYLVIRNLNLLDNIFALILPGVVNVFNIILMLNFFRQVPVELEEAATVDGASQFRILWQIYLPVSLPSLATVTLFIVVGHWNAWFDGLIYMNKATNYPMQSYLHTIISSLSFQNTSATDLQRLAELNVRSVKNAQIIVASLPILLVYPYLQKYFIKGMTLGSVKG